MISQAAAAKTIPIKTEPKTPLALVNSLGLPPEVINLKPAYINIIAAIGIPKAKRINFTTLFTRLNNSFHWQPFVLVHSGTRPPAGLERLVAEVTFPPLVLLPLPPTTIGSVAKVEKVTGVTKFVPLLSET